MSVRVLVVEDEERLRTNIARYLERDGHEVECVADGSAALEALDERAFDVVLTDLRLPKASGMAVLERAHTTQPEAVVLVMTAYASVDSVIEALRCGAHDYLLKPLSLAGLAAKIRRVAEYHALSRENARLRRAIRDDGDPAELIRLPSAPMQALCRIVEKVAPSRSSVLIEGESGTGKELVARAIHDLSDRRDKPFVPVNVSAIPTELVESCLFGHERGAFTGAERRREGLFRAASGGTLFLDEIGELPLPVQAKLLRATETREILPVGSDRPLRVDTRLLSATHRDLNAMAAEGTFREDLLYRLGVFRLAVPALRDHAEDIPTMVARFIARQSREQKKQVFGCEPEALRRLMRYAWPGNVRELSNVIERAVVLCDGERVGVADLPLELQGDESESTRLHDAIAAFERRHIASVLATCGGSREKAADLLGISPATLYRRLAQLGLKGYRGASSQS